MILASARPYYDGCRMLIFPFHSALHISQVPQTCRWEPEFSLLPVSLFIWFEGSWLPRSVMVCHSLFFTILVFQTDYCVLVTWPDFFYCYPLLSGIKRYSKFISYVLCLSPGIIHLAEEPWVLFLGSLCVHYYWRVFVPRTTDHRAWEYNMQVNTHAYTLVHVRIYLPVYVVISSISWAHPEIQEVRF